jgi:hypothetical protein
MTIVMTAVAAALLATPAMAQDVAAPPPAPVAPVQVPETDALVLPGATLAPDCGNLLGLAGRAFCVSAPIASIGTLADAYVADLGVKGWLPAGGEDNRVVFVRRREGGGCDGLQMQAFYNTSLPAESVTTGYLGFAPVPGDVCAAQPTAAPAPAQ